MESITPNSSQLGWQFNQCVPRRVDGEAAVSDDEIRDIYRLRWGVELLWKFLKMHLKLDKLITKNVNGITIQIYVSFIAYLILQILSIPQQWGYTLTMKEEVQQQDDPPEFCREAIQKALDEKKGK